MKDKFDNSYPPEVQEKAKKNLVWVTVFSITMLFAGLTSAYIVSMGGSFWVKVNLPSVFYISTAVILISSVTLYFATKAAKNKNVSIARGFVLVTLLLGLLFGVLQFLGYKKLVDNGAHFVTHIIVSDGRYGDYFEIKKDGQFLEVENNQYVFQGEKLEGAQLKSFQDFAGQFLNNEKDQLSNIDYGSEYTLYFKGEPLALVEGALIKPNGEQLGLLNYDRLRALSRNIVDNRADFFMRGELGEDFELLYNGKELEYKNRKLMIDGQELSNNFQNKLLRGNRDTSTAYFYIITILHLLHVVGGVIWLLVMTKRSFTGEITEKNALALKSGSIFWHFLGVLWIYLLLFLVFIH